MQWNSTMRRALLGARLLGAGFLLLVANIASAREIGSTEIGAVVAARGGVQVRRANAGDWKPITVGTPVYAMDEFRSEDSGRAKLLFDDESIVDIGSNSEVVVKNYAKKGTNNVLSLAAGRIRVSLPESATGDDNAFEIETPTGVTRGAGAIFIVDFDKGDELTGVYVISGTVGVQGSIGLIGPRLQVAARQKTRVQEGKFPEPVQPTSADELATLESGLELIGTGRQDGVAATHPLLTGTITRSDEKPAAIAMRSGVAPLTAGGSYLEASAPGETLVERLSPAVRANSQPIPEYKFVAPHEIPPPSDR